MYTTKCNATDYDQDRLMFLYCWHHKQKGGFRLHAFPLKGMSEDEKRMFQRINQPDLSKRARLEANTDIFTGSQHSNYDRRMAPDCQTEWRSFEGTFIELVEYVTGYLTDNTEQLTPLVRNFLRLHLHLRMQPSPEDEAAARNREARSEHLKYTRFEKKYRGFFFNTDQRIKKNVSVDDIYWHRKDVFWATRAMEEVIGRHELLAHLEALVKYYENRKTA